MARCEKGGWKKVRRKSIKVIERHTQREWTREKDTRQSDGESLRNNVRQQSSGRRRWRRRLGIFYSNQIVVTIYT